MNSILRKISTAMLLLSIIISGCASRQKTVKNTAPAKKMQYIVDQVIKNEFSPEWVSLKAAISIKSEKLTDSFKMNIRLKKDSLIWISATYYAVEVARIIITPDSVKLLDKRKKQYIASDYNYLSTAFNIDLKFNTLESIILGNTVGLSDSTKARSYTKDNEYVLSSFRKRKLKKANKDKSNNRTDRKNEIAFSNHLNPETYRPSKLAIQDFKLDRWVKVNYTESETIDATIAPKKYNMIVNSISDKIDLTIAYSKIQIDKPLKFSFNIPEKYEQVIY